MNARLSLLLGFALAVGMVAACSRDRVTDRVAIPERDYRVVWTASTAGSVFVVADVGSLALPMREESWGTALLRLENGGWHEVFRRMGDSEHQRPLLVDLSKRSTAAMLATGVYWGPHGECGFLIASRDGGKTWERIENAPPTIYGAEIIEGENWISWDSKGLYFSRDSGDNWDFIAFGGHHIRGGPRPCVLNDKSVFVSVCSGGGNRFDTLEWVSADGIRYSRNVGPLEIQSSALRRGDLYLLAKAESNRIPVLRLVGGRATSGNLDRVASLPGNLAKELQSSDGTLVAAVSTVPSHGSSITRQLFVSQDGEHWRDVLPWMGSGQFRQAAAAGDGSIWIQNASLGQGLWLEHIRLDWR